MLEKKIYCISVILLLFYIPPPPLKILKIQTDRKLIYNVVIILSKCSDSEKKIRIWSIQNIPHNNTENLNELVYIFTVNAMTGSDGIIEVNVTMYFTECSLGVERLIAVLTCTFWNIFSEDLLWHFFVSIPFDRFHLFDGDTLNAKTISMNLSYGFVGISFNN